MKKSSEVNKPVRRKAPATTTFCYTNPARQRGQDSCWGHPAGSGSTWGLPLTPWPPTFNQAPMWGQQDIMTSLRGNTNTPSFTSHISHTQMQSRGQKKTGP